MMQSVSWVISAATWIGLAAAGLGLVLWFIVRRQKQRLWLPLLRVIELEWTILPKFRWIQPPIWPFVCFVLAGLALGVFLFEPSEAVINGDNLDLRPTHVFFDLSPSVSFNSTTVQYAAAAQQLLASLSDKSKLTFSFSNGPQIYTADEAKDLAAKITDFGFHREGLHIGSALDSVLRRAPDIEHLIVMSDRDQASWEDFNWRYLEKKIQISWFPFGKEDIARDNVFIDELKPRDTGSLKSGLTWTAVLRRTGQGHALRGRLAVEGNGTQLSNHDWQFDETTKSLEIDLTLPSELLQADEKDRIVELQWHLSTSQTGDLLIDNTFTSWLQIRARKAVLIASPRGEMFLDDSIFHLKASLEVLGFRTQRMDRVLDSKQVLSLPSLIVSEVSPESNRANFCPLSWLEKQANRVDGRDLHVWLMPHDDLRDFGEICHCFASLLQAPEPLLERPAYCNNLETRDQYVGVLQSLGAAQMGGDVNSPLGALAMSAMNKQLHTRVLAFTLPLNPMRKGGVSFGQLPLLLSSLWTLIGGEKSSEDQVSGRAEVWPRIEDISAHWGEEGNRLSNVPLVESLMRPMPLEQMPPRLSVSTEGFVRQSSLATRERDSRPWIYLCLILIVSAIWLEAIGFGVGRLLRRQTWAARWFGLGLFCCLSWPRAEAQVRLNAVGYPNLPKLTGLKRDIASITSIDFAETPVQFPTFQPQALLEPWLWSATPQVLESLDRGTWTELMTWLQRGGFLVIENHGGGEAIKRRILEQMPQGAWKPIPPDHELMRSFHLLSSLPQCGGLVWEGFHFDQRIGVVLVPGDFLSLLTEGRTAPACFAKFSHEQAVRVFINLLMVALTTDYKKDQIHLPEILKRLR